jgi:hypothetical protein
VDGLHRLRKKIGSSYLTALCLIYDGLWLPCLILT